ncbi:carboxymuconolactone decarboxylase family protein [Pseudomonas aeruginosa]|nr:carboxymuconolactone decarboxylase family protein [Pseudomonas aeruginosa]
MPNPSAAARLALAVLPLFLAGCSSLAGSGSADTGEASYYGFTQPLQDFVNEHAWGSVWAREALPRKTRSLITLAALTALKCPQELKGHVRGALNNGCTVEEIREALLHCAVYAGVPAAIDAFRAAQEAIDTWQGEQPA